MKAVIQRVTSASVTSEGRTLGAINRGFLVLLGVADGDTDADLDYMLRKITGMRIFEDEQGKIESCTERCRR